MLVNADLLLVRAVRAPRRRRRKRVVLHVGEHADDGGRDTGVEVDGLPDGARVTEIEMLQRLVHDGDTRRAAPVGRVDIAAAEQVRANRACVAGSHQIIEQRAILGGAAAEAGNRDNGGAVAALVQAVLGVGNSGDAGYRGETAARLAREVEQLLTTIVPARRVDVDDE